MGFKKREEKNCHIYHFFFFLFHIAIECFYYLKKNVRIWFECKCSASSNMGSFMSKIPITLAFSQMLTFIMPFLFSDRKFVGVKNATTVQYRPISSWKNMYVPHHLQLVVLPLWFLFDLNYELEQNTKNANNYRFLAQIN